MCQSLQTGVVVAAIAVLLVAGNAWFHFTDDRRAEAFQFAIVEPAKVLEQITARAEAAKSLGGGGKGLAIQESASGRLGGGAVARRSVHS